MNILIIEDEADIRRTLQELLEINGHTVTAAATGPDGLALAAGHPDLILCDVGLPGLDGFEVIAALQRRPDCRDIPFIFLTARAERESQRRGMALGADDYITKPFTEREILDAIAARVRRQQTLRERIEELVAERRREASANWSHELLTPLNGVLGGLELIEMEGGNISPAELKELLTLIRGGAERQEKLSRKLIHHFELEQVLAAPTRAPAGCCRPADVVPAAVAPVAAEHQRAADVTVACMAGTVALGDRYLAKAVEELVHNALGFSPPGSPVQVSGNVDAAGYHLAITDAGTGMTADQRAHVGAFTQFARHDREQQGLGLGLAIVRNTARLAGGTFSLADRPGAPGLVATLTLPLAAS